MRREQRAQVLLPEEDEVVALAHARPLLDAQLRLYFPNADIFFPSKERTPRAAEPALCEVRRRPLLSFERKKMDSAEKLPKSRS